MTVKYTKTGLWIEKLEVIYRLGLSEKGQDDVGEVMFVELPEFGSRIEEGDNLISVEGAKAVTEIVSPVSGLVENVHKTLEDNVDLLNSTDRSDNWIIELTNVEGFESEQLSDDPWFGEGKPEEN
ncbi:MAG TPA: glycine cleavage system protein H [Atopostipes sp.]|nr:glycine cleavage system protein H [Atopostipes sp.]